MCIQGVFYESPKSPKSQGLFSDECAFIWNTIGCITTLHIFNKTQQLRNIPTSANREIRQLFSNETHYSHEYTLDSRPLNRLFSIILYHSRSSVLLAWWTSPNLDKFVNFGAYTSLFIRPQKKKSSGLRSELWAGHSILFLYFQSNSQAIFQLSNCETQKSI